MTDLSDQLADPAPSIEPAVYRIRMLGGSGAFATLHPPGSVLTVASNDDHGAASGAPTLSHAVDLVRLNLAEWLGVPPPGAELMPRAASVPTGQFFPTADLNGGPAHQR